jgi:hypothetical protein
MTQSANAAVNRTATVLRGGASRAIDRIQMLPSSDHVIANAT